MQRYDDDGEVLMDAARRPAVDQYRIEYLAGDGPTQGPLLYHAETIHGATVAEARAYALRELRRRHADWHALYPRGTVGIPAGPERAAVYRWRHHGVAPTLEPVGTVVDPTSPAGERALRAAAEVQETLCASTDVECADALDGLAGEMPELAEGRVAVEHAALRLRRANGGSVTRVEFGALTGPASSSDAPAADGSRDPWHAALAPLAPVLCGERCSGAGLPCVEPSGAAHHAFWHRDAEGSTWGRDRLERPARGARAFVEMRPITTARDTLTKRATDPAASRPTDAATQAEIAASMHRLMLVSQLDALTDEDRRVLFSRYCRGCGRRQPKDHFCQCENDA